MGLVLSAIGIGASLGRVIMPSLSDRGGRKPVMLISVLGAIFFLTMLSNTGAEPGKLFFYLFGTHFFNFALITLTVSPLSAEAVPAKLMATATGLMIGVGEIFGGGVAPIIAGFVAEHYGIQYILDLAIGGLAAGLFVALALRETAPVRAGTAQPAH